MFHNTTPREKLEIILQLAELCIELIQQNEEHHAEVSINFLFLSFFKSFFYRIPDLSKNGHGTKRKAL